MTPSAAASNHPTWYVELSRDAAQALAAPMVPRLKAILDTRDLGWSDLQLIQSAKATAPAPLTTEHILHRVPYQSEARTTGQLEQAAAAGLLRAADSDGYRLTDEGQALVDQLDNVVRDTIGAVTLPAGVEAIVAILARQAERCRGADCPTHALDMGQAFRPRPDGTPAEWLRRHLNDLNAFRDDAHVAAWRAYDVPGHAWEAFSHVWGEQIWGDPVSTADEVAEKLGEIRGYDADDYASALEALAARDWLARDGERYALTDEGRRVREAAERETDRIYFAPWQLTDEEADALRRGLERVRDELADPAAG